MRAARTPAGRPAGHAHRTLPILTVAGLLLLLALNGTPPRPALLEFSLWFALGTALAAASRRLEWAYLGAAGVIALVNAVSVAKMHAVGAPLWTPELRAILDEPAILMPFIDVWAWVIAALCGLLLIWTWRHSRRVRWRRWTLVVAAFAIANVGWQFSHKEQMWKSTRSWPAYASTALLLQSRKLVVPPDEANSVCCATARAEDLRLSSALPEAERPHIVVVLLESTFDIGRLQGLSPTPSAWRRWQAVPMRVFTVGGATWVQEFAVLHGVAPPDYGPDFRFINYLAGSRLQGRLAPSLASLGYHSTSLMPYTKRFYNSEAFHRRLGMDRILGCEDLPGCAPGLPYDESENIVLQAAVDLLAQARSPQLVFLLTMSNHSPHDTHMKSSDSVCSAQHPASMCSVLADYMQRETHLAAKLAHWQDQLRQHSTRPIQIVYFGDHIPESVQKTTRTHDFLNDDNLQTIAFYFDTAANAAGPLLPPSWHCQLEPAFGASDLDALILNKAGYHSAYVQAKLARIHARAQC